VTDALTRLQEWYGEQCDGDWEHQSGICIETLDNPGWFVRIDLAGTALADRTLSREEAFIGARATGGIVGFDDAKYQAACGPSNLTDAHAFLSWTAQP
jgi:hypothetical protein